MIKGSDNNVHGNIKETFFKNRGILDYKKYLALDESCVIPYENLDNINDAVFVFDDHFSKTHNIGILIDEDVDGFTSAAMMYLYVKKLNPNYPVDYIMHGKAKAHGLSNDVVIPDDIKLLIIPDASTNDCKVCNDLCGKRDMDIIILDHHQQEKSNEEHRHAIVVNNQISDKYTNKDFCGAGIVYKFLQALDDHYWVEFADDYLDLCALANISDVMDIRSYETKYIITKGLANIRNKGFKALIEAQGYSLGGHINIHNIQWYITTIINGCIRFGSDEEKELLFRSFIETEESFEYKKRTRKDKPAETVQETIYDRAARLCKNAKSRQDKAREKCIKVIMDDLIDFDRNNKIVVYDATGIVNTSLTGVVAIKIADLMNRPCILLQKHTSGKNNIVYGGSARNISNSPIESLKDIVNQTGIAMLQGHDNAAGLVGLSIDDKEAFINKLNGLLHNIVYDPTFQCDFILDVSEVNPQLISILSGFQDYIGQGISEPIIAIENINLRKNEFQILGKNNDTYKFTINDVEYVKFRCKGDDPILKWLECSNVNESVALNLVGKPCINNFNGIKTMQIIIEEVNITTTNTLDDELDIWGDLSEDDEDVAW